MLMKNRSLEPPFSVRLALLRLSEAMLMTLVPPFPLMVRALVTFPNVNVGGNKATVAEAHLAAKTAGARYKLVKTLPVILPAEMLSVAAVSKKASPHTVEGASSF